MNLSRFRLKEEDLQVVRQLQDLFHGADKSHKVVYSHFLPPIYKHLIPEIMSDFRDLAYKMSGGYDQAESFMVMVYPDYLEPEFQGFAVCELTYNSKYGEIGHRDVLGALMGLGIKRHLIGDILVDQGLVQVFMEAAMADYICSQIHKIGRVSVEISLKDPSQIEYSGPETQEVSMTVASLRLDALIAGVYQVSRAKACQDIQADRVKINHLPVNNSSKLVQEGDLLSVRGRGRAILKTIGSKTKKDRYKIIIEKYK